MSDLKPPTEPVPGPPPGDSLDGNAGGKGWLPPATAERNIAELVRASQPKIYAAPRRFDLPTIFVVTTAYAVLFAGMGALDWSAITRTLVAGFITLIGLSQPLLFGGKRPRMASLLSGATLVLLATLGIWLTGGARRYPTSVLMFGGTCTVLGGALLGYVSGAFVGGVFLVADVLRGRFRREGS